MMSTDTASVDVHVDDHADHPSDVKYVVIAIILAVLTGFEVLASALEDDLGDGLLIGSLMVMMVVKFFIVAAYFMHLKFDNPLYTKFFVAGLVLATAVYITMLSAFAFWG
jgi:cytochrome c oxidase subunit 4